LNAGIKMLTKIELIHVSVYDKVLYIRLLYMNVQGVCVQNRHV